jgi:hypothetical protein
MALAIVEVKDAEGGAVNCRVDIGTNRYFSYAVGPPEARLVEGFPIMSNPSYTSPLQGPLGPGARGHAVLQVPAGAFQGDANTHVQVTSFRERDLTGRAVSDIVPAPPHGALVDSGGWLPSVQLGEATPFAVVPFREQAPAYSSALFLEALIGLLPKLIPAVGQIVGGLLAPPGGGAPPPGSPAANVQGLLTPQNLQLLQQLLQQLLGGAAAPPPPAVQQSVNGHTPYAHDLHMAQAMIAPALLAALPALMPLLQQVLSPETIKSVLQTADPTKIIGAVTDGLTKLAQVGLESQKQEREHLERLNPGTGGPVDDLLKDMSLSFAAAKPEPVSYTRVDSVRVHFADLSLQPVNGRPQTSFRNDRDLAFPLAVETPKPITKARLSLCVKNAATHAVVVERTYAVPEATNGRLALVPTIAREEAAKLEPGQDYLVGVTLLWRAKNGRTVGSAMTQMISIVGELAFDRVEQTTEVVPLNDVALFREFWHKAWQGTLSEETRRIEFECRYHFVLDPVRTTNAQMESVTETTKGAGPKDVGTLKAGMQLSLYVLNNLLGKVSHEPALTEPELAALKTPDFGARFDQAARTRLKFRGRPGDSVAVWVVPEVKLQTLVLRSADKVNENGCVIGFGERSVRFPMPVLAHFIGVASQ